MWKCPKCGRSFKREGQDHYCGKIETVDQYIEEQDETIRPYLNEIRQIICHAIPEAQENCIRVEKQPRFSLRNWRITM